LSFLFLLYAIPPVKNNKMPVTKFSTPEKYKYQNGFGSYHE
jgi:hypothetical protein